MIDIQNKKMLEHKFAEDFSSPFYPLLADIYLIEGDLRRARKVCELGLDHNSNNIDGKFVFAKVAMAEKKFFVAEKWLKKVVYENPSHFNGLRMLIKLEFQLNRSTKTIRNYINRLLKFLHNDSECLEWLNKIQAPDPGQKPDEKTVSQTVPTLSAVENNLSLIKSEPIVGKIYEIEKSMATFTMVHVLKSQQHYNQALSVLEVLESIGGDRSKISREKDDILRRLSAAHK